MKKNLLKVPKKIILKVDKINNNEIVASCVVKLKLSEIQNNEYAHLGIVYKGNNILIPEEVTPDINRGKYSNWNINGREKKRRDLPMETAYRVVEWHWTEWRGRYDRVNKSKLVDIPYKRYPIEFIAPRFSKIKQELLSKSVSGAKEYLVRFTVNEILDKRQSDFKDRLLYVLNILQENIGCCDIDRSGISKEEYVKTHVISWEILPPGSKEEVVARLLVGRKHTQEIKNTVEERYDFFSALAPETSFIIGTSGFQRYFGVKIVNNLVVFENLDYGNALYIMYENWEELSSKSRIDLLSGRYGVNFDRIVHLGDWKSRVKMIITKKKQ